MLGSRRSSRLFGRTRRAPAARQAPRPAPRRRHRSVRRPPSSRRCQHRSLDKPSPPSAARSTSSRRQRRSSISSSSRRRVVARRQGACQGARRGVAAKRRCGAGAAVPADTRQGRCSSSSSNTDPATGACGAVVVPSVGRTVSSSRSERIGRSDIAFI